MKKRFDLMIATAILFTLFGSACKKSSNPSVNPPNPPVAVTGVQLSDNTKFGKILTDNKGMSLYFFANDAAGTSNCDGNCAVLWPAFYKENLNIGTGLDAADFGVITRTDGSKQTTYKGWPLYYFMNDTKAGDTGGDAFGELWAIAKADYTVMFSNVQLVGLDTVRYDERSLPGVGVSQYITDAKGNTLYEYTRDINNRNTFTAADFSNNRVWPIDTVSAIGSIPTVLDKTKFATITVAGRTQLVYKGHPLYYFGQDDSKRGSTKGVSFPTPGAAIWKINNNNTVALQ